MTVIEALAPLVTADVDDLVLLALQRVLP